jgi:hypothetical protein
MSSQTATTAAAASATGATGVIGATVGVSHAAKVWVDALTSAEYVLYCSTLIDLALMDEESLKYSPTMIAASVLIVVFSDRVQNVVCGASGLFATDVAPCLQWIRQIAELFTGRDYDCINKKSILNATEHATFRRQLYNPKSLHIVGTIRYQRQPKPPQQPSQASQPLKMPTINVNIDVGLHDAASTPTPSPTQSCTPTTVDRPHATKTTVTPTTTTASPMAMCEDDKSVYTPSPPNPAFRWQVKA